MARRTRKAGQAVESVKWREFTVYRCEGCGYTHENKDTVKAHAAECPGTDSSEPPAAPAATEGED